MTTKPFSVEAMLKSLGYSAAAPTVPLNLQSVLGSEPTTTRASVGLPTQLMVLSEDKPDDWAPDANVVSGNPGGNAGEKAYGLDTTPRPTKDLMLFRFMGGVGYQRFTLVATLDRKAMQGISVQSGFRGADYFLLLLNGEVDPDKVPQLREHGIEITRTKDEVTLKVTLKRNDLFGLHGESGSEFYRVYTPYTGPFFYFRMRDVGTFRYRNIRNEVINLNGSKFSVLVSPAVSQPLNVMYGTGRVLNKAMRSFEDQHKNIVRAIYSQRRLTNIKRDRFVYRVGDVVTGFNGTQNKYLVVREIYNKHADRNYYIMVQDDGKLDQSSSLADIDQRTIIQEAPAVYNSLGQLRGIDYVRTLFHANPQSGEEARQNQAFRAISDALEPKIQEVITMMGLDADAVVKPEARDPEQELPFKDPQREPFGGAFELKPGRIIYVRQLPDQTRKVMGPINTAEFDKQRKAELDKLDKGVANYQDEVRRINDEFDTRRRSGTMPLNMNIQFPYSEGWYLIVGQKERTDASMIDWILMPYPKNRKIKARVPESVGINKPGGGAETKVVTNDVEYDYFIFHLPKDGKGSLLDAVTAEAGQQQVTTVRWPKDHNFIREAEKFVHERDISGNAKRVNIGDLIAYEGAPYYVVGKSKTGDTAISYTIAPLRAFVDVVKSKMTMPFKFEPGGVAAIGYRKITKAKDGPNSLDQQARKMATAEQLEGSGLKDLFLKYYAEFDADGTPRATPLSPSQMGMMSDSEPGSPQGAQVDLEHFNTNPRQRAPDAPQSKPVDNQIQKMQSSRENASRIKSLVLSNRVWPGMLIEYNWDHNRITTEIFYGLVGEDKIRLVPHDSQDFFGKPDGVVPASGFFDVTRTGNIAKPGFWDNYYGGFYGSSSSPRQFQFAPDFEDKFVSVLKAAGEPPPKIDKSKDGYPGADEADEVNQRVSGRSKWLPNDVDNYVMNFTKESLNVGSDALGVYADDPIGAVVQHVRDGQVIRSVVISGVKNPLEPKSEYFIKVYPDSTVGMRTSVRVLDVDRLVRAQDVDPRFDEHKQFHEDTKKAFSQFIRSRRNPTLDAELPNEFKDYYRDYFGIKLQ